MVNFDQSGNVPEIPFPKPGVSTLGGKFALEGNMNTSNFDKKESSYGRVPITLCCRSRFGAIEYGEMRELEKKLVLNSLRTDFC